MFAQNARYLSAILAFKLTNTDLMATKNNTIACFKYYETCITDSGLMDYELHSLQLRGPIVQRPHMLYCEKKNGHIITAKWICCEFVKRTDTATSTYRTNPPMLARTTAVCTNLRISYCLDRLLKRKHACWFAILVKRKRLPNNLYLQHQAKFNGTKTFRHKMWTLSHPLPDRMNFKLSRREPHVEIFLIMLTVWNCFSCILFLKLYELFSQLCTRSNTKCMYYFSSFCHILWNFSNPLHP